MKEFSKLNKFNTGKTDKQKVKTNQLNEEGEQIELTVIGTKFEAGMIDLMDIYFDLKKKEKSFLGLNTSDKFLFNFIKQKLNVVKIVWLD